MLLCLAVLLASGGALAQDQQAVSALGRLEPEHGVIRVSASSTPEAILGGLLVELHVEEGDDVRKGDLLAVTDTAAVKEAQAREVEAGVEFAERGVEADSARGEAEAMKASC